MKNAKCYAVMLEEVKDGNVDQVWDFKTYPTLEEAHQYFVYLSENDVLEKSGTYYVSLYDCKRVPKDDVALSKLILSDKAEMLESIIVKF